MVLVTGRSNFLLYAKEKFTLYDKELGLDTYRFGCPDDKCIKFVFFHS